MEPDDLYGRSDSFSPPHREEKNLAVILHLSVLSGYFIPIAGFIVPLTIWLLKKDSSAYLNHQGREVMNFLISFTTYIAIAGLLCFILIGFALLPLITLAAVVLTIIAALKTSEGAFYRYPLIFRLLK